MPQTTKVTDVVFDESQFPFKNNPSFITNSPPPSYLATSPDPHIPIIPSMFPPTPKKPPISTTLIPTSLPPPADPTPSTFLAPSPFLHPHQS